jgi:hypothetical protein
MMFFTLHRKHFENYIENNKKKFFIHLLVPLINILLKIIIKFTCYIKMNISDINENI